MASKVSAKKTVEINPLNYQTVIIEVTGDTELVVHNWSHKAKEEMLATQQKKVKEKKAPKDPEQDYRASFYLMADGRTGFPVGGFKAAIVGALRFYDSIPMTMGKQAIFIEADGEDVENAMPLIAIIGEARMREDMVRLGGMSHAPDLRYRPGYPKWSAVLRIKYNASILTQEMICNLVNSAGYGGIGEGRPSKVASMDWGRFHVSAVKVIE